MSDKTAFNALESTPVAGATRGRPGPIHEELYSQLIQDVMDRVMEYVPTMGEVVGKDGGKVRVWTDDEDEPREYGFQRKRGEKFEPGQRVMVQKTRSGEMVVTGGISGKDGRDEAVDNDQLYDNAVDNRNIKNQAVKEDNISGGAVSWQKLKNDAQQRVQDAQNKADKAETDAAKADQKAGQAQNAANTAQNKADAADTKAGQAQNKADTASTKADNAKNAADAAQTDINKLTGSGGEIQKIKDDITAIKGRLDKLEKKDNNNG